MTTIAVNKDMMAADSAIDEDGLVSREPKWGTVDGHIIGFAGSFTEGRKFIDWYTHREGEKPTLDDTGVLVLRSDGKIEYWDGAMHPVVLTAKFTAIGTGAKVAVGAMERGATPEEAVRIACKYDSYTSPPVKCIKRNSV